MAKITDDHPMAEEILDLYHQCFSIKRIIEEGKVRGFSFTQQEIQEYADTKNLPKIGVKVQESVLHILRGLPGSGKTTRAKEIMETPGYRYVRVSKDDLRQMCHFGQYSPANEDIIRRIKFAVIKEALLLSQDVISDDTNLSEREIAWMKDVAEYTNAEVRIELINTPLNICIERDAARPTPVGADVINRMAAQYLKVLAKG